MEDRDKDKEEYALDSLLCVTSDTLDTLDSLELYNNEKSTSFTAATKHSVISTMDFLENDLPAVKDLPTLESILNEDPDLNDIDLSSEINLEDILKENKTVEHDISNKVQNKYGSIIRHVILRKISAQVQSATSRIEAGLPTAMAVSTVIAVGTSHGIVLIFDSKQALQLVLGTTSQGAEYGAVTALGLNNTNTRLLCGHAKGQITMWDLTNGKCVRQITDAHPPGSAVLHILFTDDLTEAVCSDSGGSVFLLTFKKVIGMRTYESQVVFSGCRGEVCAMAPLHFHNMNEGHPLSQRSLLALSTLTKVLVIALKPSFNVVFTFKLKGSPSTLPLLAWYFAVIQVSNTTKVIDPVLAFARESTIHFFRAFDLGENEIGFNKLHKITTDFKIISLHWLDSQLIAVVDNLERVHLMDVKSNEILETLDLASVELVYSSSFFKSLSTGGNVSKALALASEHSCYQSIVSFNSQLFVLGRNSIHVFTIRTWNDRINVFVKKGDYVGALKLALSIRNGDTQGVVGLRGNKEERTEIVTLMIKNVIQQFVEILLSKLTDLSGADATHKYFQEYIPVCIEYCLAIDHLDMLFNDIYEKFSMTDVTREVFLESLQSYIENDNLVSLTPIVMKDFVGYYQKKERLKEVERCLVHLDLVNLDIDQTVKLCWKYGLYDAVIYVYNRGMSDYGTPLEELMNILKSACNSTEAIPEDIQVLGYKLLVYISSCLAGRAYSVGNIPEELVKPVRTQIAETLLRRNESKDGENYPYVRTLLQFDTAEFFNVLSLGFEELDFDEDCGDGNIRGRQRFINVLLEVIVQGTGFSPSQIGSFFTFMARQIAKHSCITLNKVLFEQVLEYLSNPDDLLRHDEREQALLELFDSGALKQFDEERLLTLAENGRFYQMCEILYIKRRMYDKVLSCYFRDYSRQNQAFEFVKNKMHDESYTDLDLAELKQAVLDNLMDFVNVDTHRTAHMMLAYFPGSLISVIQKLQTQRKILYDFLKSIFDISGSSLTKFEVPSDAETNELFIELMCEFEPVTVYRHLRTASNYRLQPALEIVKRFDVIDAHAFLLEKSGDFEGAFSLLIQMLEKCVHNVDQAFLNNVYMKDINKILSSCKAALLVIIQLCQRNSRRMDEQERQNVWFSLLEVVMVPQRKLSDMTSDHFLVFKDLTRQVLSSMTGHISLPMILQKIMQDPTYNTGKFGEIRELIMGMLDTYSYEETLLTTTNQLLSSDLHRSLNHMKSLLNRGIKQTQSNCQICQRSIMINGGARKRGDIIIFRCRHCCHDDCLKNEFGADEEWKCPVCSNKNITRQRKMTSEKDDKVSTRGKTKAEKVINKYELNDEQSSALNRLRKYSKGPSRLKLLNELSKDSDFGGLSYRVGRPKSATKNLLQDDDFQLRLEPRFHFM